MIDCGEEVSFSLDVVIPVFNEEKILAQNIDKLHEVLTCKCSAYTWQIVIADNASTDGTPEISGCLAERYPQVSYLRIERRGRGGALRQTWIKSCADVVGYMDADLSSDLNVFPDLVDEIIVSGYDIAIGSRFAKGAKVIGRSVVRGLVSKAYSILFRIVFMTKFQDAQCGFKVLNRRVVKNVLPLIKDTGWFFDTELLVLAEKNGYRIKEVPIKWVDDSDSKVKIFSTVLEDLKGLLRLRLCGIAKASSVLSNEKRNR